MRKLYLVVLLCLPAAVGAMSSAGANPILLLNSPQKFQQALKKKFIKSSNSKLSVNTSIVNGLVSATGNASKLGQKLTGSWNYHGSDPNWSRSFFTLTMYLPQIDTTGTSGIDDFTFTIFDKSHHIKKWGWNTSVLTPGFDTFHFALSSGMGAGGSTFFHKDRRFKLSKAASVQISYTGVLGSSFPLTPSGTTALWTGTKSLDIVPESGRIQVLAFCGLALGFWWRARRKGRGGERELTLTPPPA